MSTQATLRVLNTTRERWNKGYSNETEEDHPVLAMFKAKGKIDRDCAGTKFKHSVKFKRRRLTGYSDMQAMEWERKNLYKTVEEEWRGLQISDAISDREMRMNRGMEARVRLFTERLDKLREDADDDVGTFLYADGNAPGNQSQPHGFLSFCHYTAGSQNLVDAFISAYDDTYYGLSTALGAYGGTGTNAGDVFETDDPEWNFFTPVGVAADWSDGTVRSWATHAVELISRAITHAQRKNRKRHMLDCFTMTRSNFFALKQQLRDKERIVVNPGPDRSLLVSLGFKNTVKVDGVDCCVDTDVPSTDTNGRNLRAAGWNFSQSEFGLLQNPDAEGDGGTGEFWNDSGMAFDEDYKTYKFWLGLVGNMFIRPRYQAFITDANTAAA